MNGILNSVEQGKSNKKYADEKYDQAARISVYLTTYIFSLPDRQINYKFLSSCCDYIEMGVYIQDIYGTYHHEKPDTEGFIRVISILKISSGVKTFTFDIDLDSELMMVPTV